MPGSLQSKGDGEYPYSAPFTGLNTSLPSILLPPSAQDNQTSPSFSIVRGSICAPWPWADNIFGQALAAGEYLLFATPSGFIFTNKHIYQFSNSASLLQLIIVANMPAGAWPTVGSNKEIPWIETNGCIYFGCQLGIYRFAVVSHGVTPWALGFTPNYLTIFNQRMVVVGTTASTNNVTPGTPTGATAGGTLPAGTYYAIVTAIIGGVEGPASSESSGVTLGAPGSINWSWTAVPGATSYKVYIGNQPGEENAVYTTGTNSFSLTSYTAGSVGAPIATPLSPWTVAWSAVSTFSETSTGSFNANPNTSSGVVGGFDVLTNYSEGLPIGIINLGHSIYIIMTQGIVEMDPAASGSAPFTFYNYWQERIPVGGMPGSLDQFGPIACFVTPDNVNIWVPGSQTQIGTAIMPYLRNLLRNVAIKVDPNAVYPLLQDPPFNASFYTFYNELHYALSFNVYGFKPYQATPPYPGQASAPGWFGMILDYNFQTQAWTQQQTPPLTTKLFQINGPPINNGFTPNIPAQTFLVAGTQDSPGVNTGWIVFAGDAFNRNAWGGVPNIAVTCDPQLCQVGFPQTPISPGHRPAVRRVRIEYSVDELSSAGSAGTFNLTVTLQGTVTQNQGVDGGNGIAVTQIVSNSVTITLNPPGLTASGPSTNVAVKPYLTATAYADFVLSLENPQVSLSWTDPSSYQRLMIHRVTLLVNDTKGVTQ